MKKLFSIFVIIALTVLTTKANQVTGKSIATNTGTIITMTLGAGNTNGMEAIKNEAEVKIATIAEINVVKVSPVAMDITNKSKVEKKLLMNAANSTLSDVMTKNFTRKNETSSQNMASSIQAIKKADNGVTMINVRKNNLVDNNYSECWMKKVQKKLTANSFSVMQNNYNCTSGVNAKDQKKLAENNVTNLTNMKTEKSNVSSMAISNDASDMMNIKYTVVAGNNPSKG